MYKSEFQGVSEVEVTYGNLEDKIGEDIPGMITAAFAPAIGALGDFGDYVTEGFWHGIDYAQDAIDNAGSWIRDTTDGIGDWFDQPDIVFITEPSEY